MFHKKARAGEIEVEYEDTWEEMMSLWSTPFMPNLMNTVVFLVETSQIIAVLFVNYKVGAPPVWACSGDTEVAFLGALCPLL